MKYNLNKDDPTPDNPITLTSFVVTENDSQDDNENPPSQENLPDKNTLDLLRRNENQLDQNHFSQNESNQHYKPYQNTRYSRCSKDSTDSIQSFSKEKLDRCYGCSKNLDNTVIDCPDILTRRRKSFRDGSLKEWVEERASKTCTKKILHKRVPIFAWLPNYNLHFAVSDLVAGVTVGLTVIPQAIAYANVAGLPPQVGLYSSFMACFVYTIFGSCKDSAIGPTAISGLLTKENNHGLGVDGAVLLCFLSGCVEFLMGVLQLGFLIDFISGPVSIGFTSAAAIIIATTQIKYILGLKITSETFITTWEHIFQNLTEMRLWDTILGFGCMAILFLLRKAKDIQVGPKDLKKRRPIHDFFSKAIWLISTARNIIVVVLGAIMAWVFEIHDSQPFRLTGFVKPGLPDIKPPPFSTTIGNETLSFIEMSSTLGSAMIVVPLLALLENIALAKVFSEGKSIDATQEMLALGLCNIASSFTMSMPVTGALSRGAVNNASGVKTTFGSIYTGIIVLFSLYFLTPYFYYIPKASLAAVIIAAVVFMVELHVVKPIWRTKKSDLIPAAATFLSCLFFRLEVGILIGISINVIFLLYASARPSVHVEKVTSDSGCDYLLVTPDRSLVFPSVEYVRSVVSKAGVKQGSSSIPVVIDSRHIQGADFTAAKGIKSLIEDFVKRNQPIVFYNLKPSVVSTFQGVQPTDFVYCKTYPELNELLKQYYHNNSTSSIACISSPSLENIVK